MTTYSYRMELNDTESETLARALDCLEERCKDELKDGPVAPFYAHQRNITAIREKLYSDTSQTSGNNFGFWMKDSDE